MRIRAKSHLRRGWTGEAEISADHPASADGQPVLLIGGEPVSTAQALLADYEVIEATPLELQLLSRGGYRFDVQVV